MKSLICPHCKVPIPAANIDDRFATCQQCGKKFKRPAALAPSQAAPTPPQTEPPAVPSPPQTASPSLPPVPPPPGEAPRAPAAFVPPIRTEKNGTAGKKSKFDFAVPLVIGGIALAVLMILGAVYILAGGKDETDPTNVAQQTDGGRGQNRPAREKPQPPKQEEGNVLDLSGLTTLDTLKPAGDNAPKTVDRPAKLGGASDYQWPSEISLISVPLGTVPSIDGVPRVSLAESGFAASSLTLPSPPGRHVIKLSPTQQPAATTSPGFPQYYRQQLQRYQGSEGLDFDKLTRAAADVGGVYRDPILPHCLGNYYWQSGNQDAAVRFWKLAVVVSPSFAPSHLNLGFAAGQRGDREVAQHELSLAAALNVQDTFGIAGHLAHLQETESFSPAGSVYSARDYLPGQQLSGKTRDVVNALLALRDLVSSPADRAGCLNNVGVYLMHEANSPAPAVGFFQQSKLALADASAADSSRISKTILQNLVKAADQAGFVEADLFRRLAESR